MKWHTFNKKRLAASRDPLGAGADDSECLTHSLRNLGMAVTPNRPGKKRAIRDGNAMLQGTGFHLEEQAVAKIQPGSYVKWYRGRFTAINIRTETTMVQELDGPPEHAQERLYTSLGDLN